MNSIVSSTMSIVFIVVLLSMFVDVKSTEFCSEEKTFLMVTNRSVSQIDFDDQSSLMIYSTPTNSSIRSSQYDRRRNLLVILLDENDRSTLITFRSKTTWTQISSEQRNSSHLFIYLTEENLYLFDEKTKRVEISSTSIDVKSSKEFHLINLPNSIRCVEFFVDEHLRLMWILVETIPHSLYLCQLDRPYSCRFLMNLVELERPIQLLVNQRSNEFFVTSRRFLFTFEYSSSQTNYSVHYVNSSESLFYYLCPRTWDLISIRLMSNEICAQRCFVTNESLSVKTYSPINRKSNCSKQRSLVRLIIILLILIDILVFVAFILWLTYRYMSKSKLSKDESSLTNGSLYVVEKNLVTQF